MSEREGGPDFEPGEGQEPVRDERDGGDPAVQGEGPPGGGSGDCDGPDDRAIDLDSVRDRAS